MTPQPILRPKMFLSSTPAVQQLIEKSFKSFEDLKEEFMDRSKNISALVGAGLLLMNVQKK